MMTLIRTLAAFAGLAAVTACASLPQMPDISMPSMSSVTGAASAPDRGSAREHVRAAVEYLDAGQEQQARAELRAALELQPNSSAARGLMQQIESDPRTLLGQRARTYTVQQGETMSQLAERFLGDPMLFYALSRYNDLSAPNQVAAGQTLSIPQRAVVTAASSTPSLPLPSPGATAATPAPLPAPPPRVAGVDPTRAGQLRLQGLQRLNTGDVNGAVTLLRQALTLDEGNPAIQRDLDRAVRMQASLRSN